jgi:carboxymethylenebutenolidase
VGYAASALPIMAQTAIKTPADGLTAGEVTIDVNGFKMPAYRAAPAGKTGLPVVLVLSEIFGVHEYIADTTRRFARAGYLAIAPELFVRQGDAQSYGEMAKLIAEVISKVPDEQVLGDLDATVKWAAANGGDAAKLGVTGFCWGGRQTWLYAAHNPAVKAGVAWYGRLVGAQSPLNPRHPVDVAARLNGPVLGLYGAADTGIPLDTVDKMKAHWRPAMRRPRHHSLWCTLTRRTPFMPTTARASARSRPKTAGSGPWPGLRSTAWPDSTGFSRTGRLRAAFLSF